jgi:ubiquinone/menaquinone biosynthesis C-methylase UbiE
MALTLLGSACDRVSASRADTRVQATQAAAAEEAQVRASYEAYRQPDRVVRALEIAPGQRVADVGAGRGFLTSRLAAAVGPRGQVVATDIDPAALASIPRAGNVETRLVRAEDPGLERAAYDRILVAEVDHYLVDRAAWLRKAAMALAPGGFIGVTNRLPYREPMRAAAAQAGLRVVEVPVELPAHFFFRLEAP